MKTKTNYVAEDGRVFATEEECKKYEEEINESYQSWQDALKQRAAIGTKIKDLEEELKKYAEEYDKLSDITEDLYDDYCRRKKTQKQIIPDYFSWLFDLA